MDRFQTRVCRKIVYVNNIQERGNLEETPVKWGEEEIENFPLRDISTTINL